MYRIVRHEQLTPSTFRWDVDAPDVAAAARPGQFVMVRLHEGSERVPLTIADMDPGAGTVTLVVQVLGRSTQEMAEHYHAGDAVADLVGPLGLPAEIERVGHVVLVGGGLGVAPVFPQVRAFRQAGNRTTVIVGFRTAPLAFWLDRLGEWADEVIVCTDDGSLGRAGLVTDALHDALAAGGVDRVVAIGPLVMMKACAETSRPFGVPTVASLNTIMVDGTGMCGSCRVSVEGEVRFACVEGPEFDAHHVDFDELLVRQRRFASQEAQARDDYAHVCSLEQSLFVEGRHAYKKLRDVAPTRTPMPQRDPSERVRSFEEVNLGYDLTAAVAEAERCIQCAKPTCIAGCPVAVDIPRFLRHLLVRDLDGALGVIHEANVLPSVCGRVCPQESQCEAQCIVGRKLEPVAIGRLERFVGDHASAPAVPAPAEGAAPLGRVAIAGSGPAGLACAADLVRLGAEVTVFEGLHVVGGVLRYGIPAFRLPRAIIDREVERLAAMGVRFETDKVIGQTFTVPQLLSEKGFDAVFVGVGAGAPAFLGIPGEHALQVSSANEFLTRVNLMGGDRFPLLDTPVQVGRRVVVVGAGNTAMDCLRVARRLGVPSVTCVYRRSRAEVPARAEEVRHAEEEGVEFRFLHDPAEVLTDAGGNVTGLRLRRMALGEPDEAGRCRPVPTGEEVVLACDTVVVALGTRANPVVPRSTPGLALDRRGHIVADPATQATSVPGVFAGGDIVTGGATVILAMGAGRRAAAAIGAWLGSDRAWPPDAAPAPAAAPAGRPRPPHACTRCGRPTDGDDDGHGDEAVCCAGAVLSWRCEGCGKVSEGFAFPYGTCPQCGGHLVARDGAGGTAVPAGPGAVETVRMAAEIELGGIGLYATAAAEAADPALAELFGRFAAMEREHLATLARRYHVELAAPTAPAAGPAHVASAVATAPDPAELFRRAIAAEERAARLFGERAAAAADDGTRRLCEELAAEEREHAELLANAFERWRRGAPVLL